MCLHPGNTSEQVTAVPLEKEITKMLGDAKFIYCADAGLGSYNIRKFNSMGGKAFIVTQSIKKLSDTLKQAVLNPFITALPTNPSQPTKRQFPQEASSSLLFHHAYCFPP